MAWRNYYRPKQKDPKSIAALERLDRKELEKKKKYFENKISLVNKRLNHKEFKKLLNNIPKEEILKKKDIILKDFNKINEYIKFDTRYYALKSIFGNLKHGRIVSNITCEDNDKTRKFLKDFKDYTKLIYKYSNYSKENKKYIDLIFMFLNTQRSIDQIKNLNSLHMSSEPYEEELPGYNILDNVDTGLFAVGGKIDLSSHHASLRDHARQPLKSNDKYWSKALECTLSEFRKIDLISGYDSPNDLRNAYTQIYLVGTFFKKIFQISKDNPYHNLTYIFSEEIFLDIKNTMLKFYNSYLRKITLINRSEKRKNFIENTLNNIYVLSNKSYDGVYKVGWTSNLPEERAEQLSSETGVLYPFKVEFSKEFKDAEKIEKKIHRKFKIFRLRNNKEFFKIDKEKLIKFIIDIK